MELMAIGFLLGVVVCFVVAGCGMYYAERMAKGKHHKHKGCCRDNNGIDRECGCFHGDIQE